MTRPNPKVPFPRPLNEDTRFYIDYDWWEESGRDLKTYLLTRLPISDDISLDTEAKIVDVVDMKTGEVRQVDSFQYLLQSVIKSMPNDRIQHASLVDAVFYVLLGNANQPLSAHELSDRVQRPAGIILRTLTGRQIFLGIRPLLED